MSVVCLHFERVSVDLIAPFSPKSNHGNRHILPLIDYVTRYSDAIAVPAIHTVHLAEGLG